MYLPCSSRGVGPTLSFSYNSSSGNGTLGIGWEIPIPFISRQTDKGLPRYNNSDRFIYNQGQELVKLDLPSDEEYPHWI
jgi:hypothetical protein